MLHPISRILAIAVLSLAAPAIAAAAEWALGENSRVGFRTTQGGQPVEGLFERFDAVIDFDPDQLELSSVAVIIEIASVSSGSADRDTAIKSAPLFDADTWPTAQFSADRFTIDDDGYYQAQGTLTMRDVTQPVGLPFTLTIEPDGEDPKQLRASAQGELQVRRLDYGIGQGLWQDTSMVPNEITIFIDISATRLSD